MLYMTPSKGAAAMYRQYEDPYEIQTMLNVARAEYNRELNSGAHPDDLIDLVIRINELEERLNFAWQDDEATQFGYDY